MCWRQRNDFRCLHLPYSRVSFLSFYHTPISTISLFSFPTVLHLLSLSRYSLLSILFLHQPVPGLQDMFIKLQGLIWLELLLLYLQHGAPSTV